MPRWTQKEHEDARRSWLRDRCGHQWGWAEKGVVRCTLCNRKQGRNAPWRCPKRHLPNRWRLHFRRHLQRLQVASVCPHCHKAEGRYQDGHIYREHFALWLGGRLRELEHAAKRLPQDMRHWKGHPVAVEYRKRVTQWWALPSVDYQQAANLSPTINLSLIGKGQLDGRGLGERYLDRLYAERTRQTGIVGWRDRVRALEEPQFTRVQDWRRAHDLPPLDLPAVLGGG